MLLFEGDWLLSTLMQTIILTVISAAELLFLAEFWSRLAQSRRQGYAAASLFLLIAIAFSFALSALSKL